MLMTDRIHGGHQQEPQAQDGKLALRMHWIVRVELWWDHLNHPHKHERPDRRAIQQFHNQHCGRGRRYDIQGAHSRQYPEGRQEGVEREDSDGARRGEPGPHNTHPQSKCLQQLVSQQAERKLAQTRPVALPSGPQALQVRVQGQGKDEHHGLGLGRGTGDAVHVAAADQVVLVADHRDGGRLCRFLLQTYNTAITVTSSR